MKFLIIRFSSIGDIVLTSPIVRRLKSRYPDSEIHFVTKKAFAGLVRYNPYIDKVHILDGSLRELISQLRKESFDYVIDLHDNIRSRLIKIFLKKPCRTYNKQRFRRWLLVKTGKNTMRGDIVSRYAETLLRLDVKDDGKGLDFFVSPDTSVDINSLPEGFEKGYVAMVVGTMHFTKQLPLKKQVDICKNLSYPVLLLGGPKESELAEQIIKLSGKKNIVNACGKYSLSESALWVKESKAVITNDTGLMHVAAAYDKPIFATYGNSVSAFGFDPYRVKSSFIFEVNLPCRPCTKFGGKYCPKGHFNCMNLLDGVAIAEKASLIF